MGFIIAILLAYLFGSIPTAVWVGKATKGIDVREYGSGNAGATNTMRVLGTRIAIPVLLIDILKGFVATQLATSQYVNPHAISDLLIESKLLLGIIAVVGHIFPVFAGFKGGKGIATFFGVLIGIHPLSALITVGLFVSVVAVTRYISLGSIMCALFYPFQLILIFNYQSTAMVIFAILIPVMVIITHRKNIDRLLKGEENKFHFVKSS